MKYTMDDYRALKSVLVFMSPETLGGMAEDCRRHAAAVRDRISADMLRDVIGLLEAEQKARLAILEAEMPPVIEDERDA